MRMCVRACARVQGGARARTAALPACCRTARAWCALPFAFNTRMNEKTRRARCAVSRARAHATCAHGTTRAPAPPCRLHALAPPSAQRHASVIDACARARASPVTRTFNDKRR
jgi:hypothetical protein